MIRPLEIRLLDEQFALARLPHGSAIQEPLRGSFAATIHSVEGISMVCLESAIPAGARYRGGFRCFEVTGAFDLEAVGVVASIAQPLAEAGVSLFAYSTWQTDYILVHGTDIDRAMVALTKGGHRIAQRQSP
jgi:hypothetical protein